MFKLVACTKESLSAIINVTSSNIKSHQRLDFKKNNILASISGMSGFIDNQKI